MLVDHAMTHSAIFRSHVYLVTSAVSEHDLLVSLEASHITHLRYRRPPKAHNHQEKPHSRTFDIEETLVCSAMFGLTSSHTRNGCSIEDFEGFLLQPQLGRICFSLVCLIPAIGGMEDEWPLPPLGRCGSAPCPRSC